ncbi:MAG: C40 family peptidase, partial [Coriobacteriales bacterium]
AYEALMPGDLVFFGPSVEGIHHVGIYVGDGKYIQAPRTGDVVKVSSLSNRSDYVGACRPQR